ncbi:MAG: hypothetical protein CVT64_08590 [Actinobacteria bacterium HGW-Actinobacteria-4]|nr:MAG: hypothetical protein CVT64_08590 [Actinobacteria bacterium HGW-Actinobacteria-4]
MRSLSLAVAAITVASLAGCGVLPEGPPPLPPTFVPVVEVSARPDGLVTSTDGFTNVQRISMRVRGNTCTQFINGSAWVLNENTLITNRHVIEGAQNLEVTSYDGRDYTVTSSVLSTVVDLAMMTVDAEFTEFAVISADGPEIGDQLSIVGYPNGDRLETNTGRYYASVPDTLDNSPDFVYAIAAASRPGSSGSPVANQLGEIVGVLYAGDEGENSYAVKLSSLTVFLEDTSTHKPNPFVCN